MQIPSRILSNLEEILYSLHYIEDLQNAELFPEPAFSDNWKYYFLVEEIKEKMVSLEWAITHEHLDFKEMGTLQALDNFSNADLIYYMKALHSHLQKVFTNEVFETLKVPDDNRPLKILRVTDMRVYSNSLRKRPTYTVVRLVGYKEPLQYLCENLVDVLVLSYPSTHRSQKETNIKLVRKIRGLENQRLSQTDVRSYLRQIALKLERVLKREDSCQWLVDRQVPLPILVEPDIGKSVDDEAYLQTLSDMGCIIVSPPYYSRLLKEIYRVTTPAGERSSS